MTQPTIIHLVRHGEVHNPQQVLYGRLPTYRLSEHGRNQAQAAGEALRDKPLAAVFSSPQPRTQETAAFIREHHRDLKIIIEPRIDEIHSPYEGHPLTIFEQPDFDLYRDVEHPFDTPVTMLARTLDFIRYARETYAEKEIAAVTHGDIVAFMFLFSKETSPETRHKKQMLELGLPEAYPATASISTFTFASSDPDEVPTYDYQRPY